MSETGPNSAPNAEHNRLPRPLLGDVYRIHRDKALDYDQKRVGGRGAPKMVKDQAKTRPNLVVLEKSMGCTWHGVDVVSGGTPDPSKGSKRQKRPDRDWSPDEFQRRVMVRRGTAGLTADTFFWIHPSRYYPCFPVQWLVYTDPQAPEEEGRWTGSLIRSPAAQRDRTAGPTLDDLDMVRRIAHAFTSRKGSTLAGRTWKALEDKLLNEESGA